MNDLGLEMKRRRLSSQPLAQKRAHGWGTGHWGAIGIFLLICAGNAFAKDAPRSFSLSTSRTFAPGESVKIQLFARNVPEFEFRVYKVKDPVEVLCRPQRHS